LSGGKAPVGALIAQQNDNPGPFLLSGRPAIYRSRTAENAAVLQCILLWAANPGAQRNPAASRWVVDVPLWESNTGPLKCFVETSPEGPELEG